MFWYNIDVSDMSMFGKMCAKRDEIHAIARKRKAERLWTFGSCARKWLSCCHELHATGSGSSVTVP